MLEGLVEETQYLAVYFCKYIVLTIQFILFQIDTYMNFSILKIYIVVSFGGLFYSVINSQIADTKF
jgi:hypothetical protein